MDHIQEKDGFLIDIGAQEKHIDSDNAVRNIYELN